MRSRRRITPAIGGYWLRPALMYLVTRSRSSFAQSKSGKPCDRLIALCSCARRDITVKMVVPTSGSLEAMGRENDGIAAYFSSGLPSALWTCGGRYSRGWLYCASHDEAGDSAVPRWVKTALCLVSCALCLGAHAQPQPFPSKPIRWIVPSSPGGANDVLARIMGPKLTQAWGQPVVI